MLDGEELIGAKQNRIVNLTILVPAKTNLPIPVTCVEAGRWRHRSRGFTSSGNAHHAHARARKVAQVSHSLAQTGEARSDQQWIWADIAAKAARLEVNSDTSAMSNLFDAHQPSIDEYVTAFGPVDGQRGAVFLLDGIPVGLDLFESDVVLRKLMPKLVRSHALDALDTSDARAPKQSAPPVAETRPRRSLSASLARLNVTRESFRLSDSVRRCALMAGRVLPRHLYSTVRSSIWRRSIWVTHEEDGQDPRISGEH